MAIKMQVVQVFLTTAVRASFVLMHPVLRGRRRSIRTQNLVKSTARHFFKALICFPAPFTIIPYYKHRFNLLDEDVPTCPRLPYPSRGKTAM